VAAFAAYDPARSILVKRCPYGPWNGVG